jgi:hypothetical protein
VALLLSIGGAGCITGGVIREAADSLAQREYTALRAHSGTARVTVDSKWPLQGFCSCRPCPGNLGVVHIQHARSGDRGLPLTE